MLIVNSVLVVCQINNFSSFLIPSFHKAGLWWIFSKSHFIPFAKGRNNKIRESFAKEWMNFQRTVSY